MQESSENRDLARPTPTAYSVSFDLTSHQRTDSNKNINNLLPDYKSVFTSYTNIPDEIALLILHYLDMKDLCTASSVNKKWLQLVNDKNILNKFIQPYNQGNLWIYLSKNPQVSTYQAYFREVFGFSVDFSSFNMAFFNAVKSLFLLNQRYSGVEYQKVREEFFKVLAPLSDDKLLLEAVSDSKEILSILQTTKKNETMSLSGCRKIISLLIHINTIDTLITDYLFIIHYAPTSKNWTVQWLADPKKTRLLSGKAIVALMPLIGVGIIQTIYKQKKLVHLLTKLSEEDVFKIIELNFHATEIFILDPHIISKLSDKGLIALSKKLPSPDLKKYFYKAIEENSSYSTRCQGDFLISLGESNPRFNVLILNHPRLMSVLSEDQFISLASQLIYSDLLNLLDNSAFWELKVTDRENFLLRLPHLKRVISHNKAAGFLSPASFFPLSQFGDGVVCALAEQEIILKKLNDKQLMKLASCHSGVAITLLKNKAIMNRWTESLLQKMEKKVKTNFADIVDIDVITDTIQQIRKYRLEEKQKLNLTQRTKIVPSTQAPSQSDSAQVSKPIPSLLLQNRVKHVSINKPHGIKISKAVKIFAIVFITLLAAALLATGIGGLIGVGFFVSALAAFSFLSLSVKTLVITCLIAGALSLSPAIAKIFMSIKNKLKAIFCPTSPLVEPKSKFRRRDSYEDLTKTFGPSTEENNYSDLHHSDSDNLSFYPSIFVSRSSSQIVPTEITFPPPSQNKHL